MSKHLIVGIDGSPESEAAMAWALEEATRRDLEIELVYALAVPVVSDAYGMVMTRPDIDELTDYSQKLLDAALTVGAGRRAASGGECSAGERPAGGGADRGVQARRGSGGGHPGPRRDQRQAAGVGERPAGRQVGQPGVHRAARVARAHAAGRAGAGRRRRLGALRRRAAPRPGRGPLSEAWG